MSSCFWALYIDLACCIHHGLQIDSLLAMCTLHLAILSSFFESLWSLHFTSILHPWVIDNFMCMVHDAIYYWWLCLRCWPSLYSSHLRCHDHLVLRHLLMSLLDLVQNSLEGTWGDRTLFAKTPLCLMTCCLGILFSHIVSSMLMIAPLDSISWDCTSWTLSFVTLPS